MATSGSKLSTWNISELPHHVRKTRIICTLGPVSRSVEVIEKMINAGMNIARFNFSHGSHEYHAETIKNVRKAVSNLQKKEPWITIAIALDTKGPEIRTGILAEGPTAEVDLVTGQVVRITTDPKFESCCTPDNIWVDYQPIFDVASVGSRMYIDDGLISLLITEKGASYVSCTVEEGGKLGSRKGVNFPGIPLNLPDLSEKDEADLKFGVEQEVDIIFASFTRNGDGIRSIRKCLGQAGSKLKIIAKIENHEGIYNIDEIIKEADGVMVARGDLGIEISAEKVCLAQKMIIAKCNRAGKPVICATQMLESMISKPCPTRAEGSDVTNAVLDGADAVMLSGETAKGDFPLKALETMHQICREAEACVNIKHHLKVKVSGVPVSTAQSTAIAATAAAVSCHARAMVVVTTTGKTASMLSNYRPPCPIIAVTRYEEVGRQLLLHYGVFALHYPPEWECEDWSIDVDNRINFGVKIAKERRYIQQNDCLVLINGWRKGPGFTNTLRVVQAP